MPDSSGGGGGGGSHGAVGGAEARRGEEGGDLPSEETIHHVLAYLSSITRPSKAVNVETDAPPSQPQQQPNRGLTVSRQPTVKFSPNPLMIPTERRP